LMSNWRAGWIEDLEQMYRAAHFSNHLMRTRYIAWALVDSHPALGCGRRNTSKESLNKSAFLVLLG
jgi:hypothetical protein